MTGKAQLSPQRDECLSTCCSHEPRQRSDRCRCSDEMDRERIMYAIEDVAQWFAQRKTPADGSCESCCFWRGRGDGGFDVRRTKRVSRSRRLDEYNKRTRKAFSDPWNWQRGDSHARREQAHGELPRAARSTKPGRQLFAEHHQHR